MATYYHGAPEMQPDGLQTLYLMNPSYISYAEAATPASMILLNSTVSSPNPMNLAATNHHHHHHQPPPPPVAQQHFVGIPLQSASHESGRTQSIHGVSSAVQELAPRLHYDLWTQSANNSSTSTDVAQHQLGLGRSSQALPSAQQALSLSLSPHEMVAPVREMVCVGGAGEVKTVGSDGLSGLHSFLMGSKYLKAAQELLDEVVNVGKGGKGETVKRSSKDSEGSIAAVEEESSGKRIAADLSTVERQDLQMKKAKLVSMLDEVEQRYRQYHHQMQIVVSSFEAIAGPGSARTYTALALKTISKQFRCLRDAIAGQILATSKILGEEETKSAGSRLRFIDHHLRQQRALQQFGIIQHNAWRPQRGLPERSVSTLRAWLFEHFLHPYPKDSDKHMLANQTGLTKSQVSNWFINARVRLWKPMVEEMYLEEIKDQEENNGDENSNKSDATGSPATKSSGLQESSGPAMEGQTENLKSDQGHASTSVQASYMSNGQNQDSYYDNETIMQPTLKKARSNESSLHGNVMSHSITLDMKPEEPSNQELLLKFMDGRQRVEDQGYSLIPSTISHGGNYGAYTIGELGQFTPRYSNNGVALTLGLPHCDNISLAEAQQSFLSNESMQPLGRRLDMGTEASELCSLNNNATVAHSSTAFESINIQNRKRFAAQLLPDYVA